jgi:alkaline phosphatase D
MKIVLTLLSAVLLATSAFSQKDNDFLREKGVIDLYPFYHGVASGDPLDDAVILWTRVTDDTLTADSVQVNWRIATDTLMTNIVNSGSGYAAASRDWTFKVDATGLQPGTWYYYDFESLGSNSIIGRTKTAPVGDVDSLRFGVVSCSSYEHGYFGAYRHLMDRNDIDCILHLGDYIYEYEVGGYSSNISGREYEPAGEIVTLEDYRIRHSHYKLDEDLRKLHQQYPFIVVWDDHETANDSYKDGAENHDPGTEGLWTDRLGNAGQAYHEWLPIRTPQPGQISIYRSFEFGDLLNLPMIDTRIEGRDEQGGAAEANDPARSLLGTTQYNWLTNNLATSTKQWNIVGNQVMIAPLEVFGTPVNYDQWDGYNYEREQLLNFVSVNVPNFIVLTGDIHTSWVNDIPLSNYDGSNCTGSAGVEFVVTSVTSPGLSIGVGTSLIQSMNSHMQYIDLAEKGYGVLDVNKTRTQFDFYYLDDVTDAATGEYYAEGYYMNDGERCANQASGASTRPGPAPFFAPDPEDISASVSEISAPSFVVLGAYPNPANDKVTFQMYAEQEQIITIQVFDLQGRKVFEDNMTNVQIGVNYAQLNISDLEKGTYQFVITSGLYKVTKSIIKY